jgi:hypothetical protein
MNKICVRCGMEYPNHKMSCKIPVEEWRLPTAEELGNRLYKPIGESCKEFAIKLAKEFAKLHVQEALKVALQQLDDEGANHVRSSILNSYPLELIK